MLVVAYGVLAIAVTAPDGLVPRSDDAVLEAVAGVHQAWLTNSLLVVSRSAEMWVVLGAAVGFAWLWRRGDRTAALLLVVSAMLIPALGPGLKGLTGRSRPMTFPPLDPESTFAFPSGHTLAAVGAYGFIAVALWQRNHRTLATICGLWVLAVGASRVYLGAHYPSDVLAALLIGSGVLIALFCVEGLVWGRDRSNGLSDGVSDTVTP